MTLFSSHTRVVRGKNVTLACPFSPTARELVTSWRRRKTRSTGEFQEISRRCALRPRPPPGPLPKPTDIKHDKVLETSSSGFFECGTSLRMACFAHARGTATLACRVKKTSMRHSRPSHSPEQICIERGTASVDPLTLTLTEPVFHWRS